MGEDSVEGAGFWLPSEFFTDDDFLLDKENFTKNNSNPVSASEFCFTTEVPYYFKPESNENVENFWLMSTSPQSTVAHMGSLNGVPSPPTTSLGSDCGDLIHRAAGQVAMLKLSAGGDRLGFRCGFEPGPTKDTRFVGPPRYFTQHAKNPTASVFQHAQLQGYGVAYGQRQVYQNRGKGACSIQQNPTRILLGGSGGGGTVKRECAGTGVFLPRRYDDNTSDSRKRPGGGAATLYPTRAATQALNKRFDNIAGFDQSQLLSRPLFNKDFIQDYDLFLARKHALMLRQQRSTMISREMYLPQEWTN